MEIVEDLPGWKAAFESGWLTTYRQTGQMNWKLYQRPRNQEAPAGRGVDLAQSRLLLISSAGAYMPAAHAPFDAENDLGDYSIRVLPSDASFAEIAYAHTHYDHAAVNADPQVLLPLLHLETLVGEGKIGALTPNMISFGGYQPDVERVLRETIPAVLAVAEKEQAHAALLVPA